MDSTNAFSQTAASFPRGERGGCHEGGGRDVRDKYRLSSAYQPSEQRVISLFGFPHTKTTSDCQHQQSRRCPER